MNVTKFARHLGMAGVLAICASVAALAQQAPTCGRAQGPDCLYFPAARYGFTPYERSTSYTDISGQLREIRVRIRVPQGALAPLPVVIWSHGGAQGKNSPANSLAEWSAVTATAGYLTVSIAHAPRSDASRAQLCQAIGIADNATCQVFKHLNWDRPHDIRAVIDELERMNRAGGEFGGLIDLHRIAVGGHSAGAGGAQTVGGALRVFVASPENLSDPRPIAFLAFSPQGPGSEGFFDTRFGEPLHSWAPLRRPVLTATGDGDSTCDPGPQPGSCIGDTPFGRRIGFQRMAAEGNKYHLYVHDADAFHGLFSLSVDKCAERGIAEVKCYEFARWLSSAALAFLDGHVREVPAALQWLQSHRIENASRGVAEWQRK